MSDVADTSTSSSSTDQNVDKPFFVPTEDMTSYDIPPFFTELVRPVMNGLDFSKIGNFSSILGSINETGQTFRNVFNNSVSPTALANMAQAGLQTELSKILGNSGISKFFGTALSSVFRKTSYSYPESEKKLRGSPNINIDFNPNGLFNDVISKLLNAITIQDSQKKEVEDFYITANIARKKIWITNGALWTNTEKIRVLHSEANVSETVLTKIFHTEEVYSSRFSDYDQLKNLLYVLEEYLVKVPTVSTYVRNKEDYAACVTLLKSQVKDLVANTKYIEMKYVYEDLKLLRRTPDQDFKSIP